MAKKRVVFSKVTSIVVISFITIHFYIFKSLVVT